MVGRHWGLTHDPFADGAGPFVETPGHREAAERLVHAIEVGERLVAVDAPAGLGKSRVLDHVLGRCRDPSRRIARVSAPVDGAGLLAGLAEGLGVRLPAAVGRSAAWKGLADAVRVCRFAGQSVVLAVDDAHVLDRPADRHDLLRLPHLDAHPSARLTVVMMGRDSEEADPGPDPWGLAIRLAPLSRSETGLYLEAKLAGAGRAEVAFTPRAVTRLQALCGGVPRGLDRLASLALMAGAVRGLEIITPDVVEGAARECVGI